MGEGRLLLAKWDFFYGMFLRGSQLEEFDAWFRFSYCNEYESFNQWEDGLVQDCILGFYLMMVAVGRGSAELINYLDNSLMGLGPCEWVDKFG